MEESTTEIVWKDVPEYEGFYQISNIGEIKSIFRKTPHKYNTSTRERILTKNLCVGYYYIRLSKNGKTKAYRLHRIIAKVFVPNPHNKAYVNHIDGNKLNNSISNLEWVTKSENSLHAVSLGLKKSGEESVKAKLTEKQVLIIKRLYRINPQSDRKKVASKLNIHVSTIYDILNGRSWNYIKN